MRPLLLLCAVLLLASCTAPPPPPPVPPTVVLLVRHAETTGEGTDPGLNAIGQARAEALRQVAADAGVTAVLATSFRRTQDTAAPFAQDRQIAVEVVPVTRETVADHPADVARRILTKHAGQSVMVVGHSNTIPAIVAALGGPSFPDLDHDRYDALFTVIYTPEGPVRTIVSRYGPGAP